MFEEHRATAAPWESAEGKQFLEKNTKIADCFNDAVKKIEMVIGTLQRISTYPVSEPRRQSHSFFNGIRLNPFRRMSADTSVNGWVDTMQSANQSAEAGLQSHIVVAEAILPQLWDAMRAIREQDGQVQALAAAAIRYAHSILTLASAETCSYSIVNETKGYYSQQLPSKRTACDDARSVFMSAVKTATSSPTSVSMRPALLPPPCRPPPPPLNGKGGVDRTPPKPAVRQDRAHYIYSAALACIGQANAYIVAVRDSAGAKEDALCSFKKAKENLCNVVSGYVNVSYVAKASDALINFFGILDEAIQKKQTLESDFNRSEFRLLGEAIKGIQQAAKPPAVYPRPQRS